jgi:hypothetical protein
MFPSLCDTASARGASSAGTLRALLVDLFLLEEARARP